MTRYKEAENFIADKLQRELPKDLAYHSFFHVMDVLDAALRIADHENIQGEDLNLLRIAILFHDSGFMSTYQDHEEEGCRLVKTYLPDYGFDEQQIEKICGMVMSTKIPQSAKTLLEQTICDADLDYLGRDDFYSIGRTLYREWKIYLNVQDEKQWNIIQMKFLKAHFYHTSYSKKYREGRKQEHLSEISKIVEGYTVAKKD